MPAALFGTAVDRRLRLLRRANATGKDRFA
jgi:hypothetical protein